MLAESIRQSVCCDELQLGSKLNQCVGNGQQAAFALWLSLLSPDVCDQPQFEFDAQDEPQKTTHWRDFFALEPQQPLYADHASMDHATRYSSQIHQGAQVTVFLEQALQRPPLCRRRPKFDPQIMNNLSLLKQLKLNPPELLAADTTEESITPAAMVNVLEQFDFSKPITRKSPPVNIQA